MIRVDERHFRVWLSSSGVAEVERNQKMQKLKDLHKDIERYLNEDCYCPNEVYSADGFFYQLVYADADAELLGTYHKGNENVLLVATYNSDKEPILLNIWYEDEKVISMERYELTENNIREIKAFWKGEKEKVHLSEADKIKEDLQKIMSIADAVIVD